MSVCWHCAACQRFVRVCELTAEGRGWGGFAANLSLTTTASRRRRRRERWEVFCSVVGSEAETKWSVWRRDGKKERDRAMEAWIIFRASTILFKHPAPQLGGFFNGNSFKHAASYEMHQSKIAFIQCSASLLSTTSKAIRLFQPVDGAPSSILAHPVPHQPPPVLAMLVPPPTPLLSRVVVFGFLVFGAFVYFPEKLSGVRSHVFGLTVTATPENIFYVDESTIIFPAGCNVVVADVDQGSQKFIPATEKAEAISALTVSPDRHIFAVAERAARPSLVIYDLHSFRKRRTLPPCPESQGVAKEFTSMAFSADGRYLAAQLGSPELILHYYSWEKGRLLATFNFSSIATALSGPAMQSSVPPPSQSVVNKSIGPAAVAASGDILQIAICPNDSCQISVLADTSFRVFRYSEGFIKLSFERKGMPKEFTCHCWMFNDRIAVGTSDGRILVCTMGEVLQELRFGPAGTFTAVSFMIHMSRGLIVSSKSGHVEVMERFLETEAKVERLKLLWRMATPDEGSPIRSMAISGSEGSLLVCLENYQLLKMALAWSEIMKGEDIKFEPLFHPSHHSAITGLDVCCRKPLLATCGTDRSVRIWNYHTRICELCKIFPEEPFSVSLHPSGLYILVGFSDKLRLFNVLIDDFRLFKEIGIRSCRECSFSNGGHIFAAAYGNTIQIYSTWTFDNIGNLKGHNGKVKSIHWTPDDSVLISSGADGAVYTWLVRDFKRESEHILKSCSYTSAVCTPDGKLVYAVGSDKLMKEISESTVTHQVESNVTLTQLAISNSGRMMFAGTLTGQVRSIKYPFSGNSEDYQEHQAHSAAVTKFKISYDDQYLFSVADDGCLFMYKIADKDDRSIKRDRGSKRNQGSEFADEILITKSDLEEKTVLMSELQRSLEELKLEHEYQLRLKDMNFNEKLKEITEKYSQEIEALKISTSVLRTEKDKEEVRHEEELQALKSRQMNELHDVEAKYNQNLMEEYEKFQALQQNAVQKQESWQKQMRDYDSETQRQLSDTQAEAEARLNQKASEAAKLQAEMQQQLEEFEEMTRQNDDDIDSEVTLVQNRYEKRVRVEREEGARLKGENGLMRKKFNSLNKDIEDNKAEILRAKEDEKRLRAVIASLEKEIASFKKEMAERDEMIQDKERRVYDLKKKNQELEKFKFVLDYRIKELKQQDINIELEILSKQKALFESEINSLNESLETAKQEYNKEHRKYQDYTHYSKAFRTDLHDAIQYIQEPPILKKHAEQLSRKYRIGSADSVTSGMEPEVKWEYLRQQDMLKEQIFELRAKVENGANKFRADNIRSMMDNQGLIGYGAALVIS
ncbi:WD repeat-containing protein 65-like protein [Zopfochytrium polystomum]|nr:WD repeat-containing protein 65-like protein [Zopfochytrium polystomum]